MNFIFRIQYFRSFLLIKQLHPPFPLRIKYFNLRLIIILVSYILILALAHIVQPFKQRRTTPSLTFKVVTVEACAFLSLLGTLYNAPHVALFIDY
jgi:hypothetical protein